MNKKLLVIMAICLMGYSISFAKAPKIAGNFESGSRYSVEYDELEEIFFHEDTEDMEQETWAYDFQKGYLQLSQEVNKNLRYSLKYDYISKDFYAATTNNKNKLDYYRAYSWIGLPSNFKLKVGYYVRQQDYTIRQWDNMTHVPNMLLQWKPDSKKVASLSMRYKAKRYDESTETWKDADEIASYIGYTTKVWQGLTLNTKYRYNFRRYVDNPDKSNSVKKSLSVGFEHQF
jgi:hypothetical protein